MEFPPMDMVCLEKFRAPYHSKAELEEICKFFSGQLKLPEGEDRYAFLRALAEVETSFAYKNFMKNEPAYGPGGVLYQRSEMLKQSYSEWGALVSASFGPFQIMYVVARENGFPKTLSPMRLWSGFVSGPFVLNYLNACIAYGAKTVDALAAGYNGGKGVILYPKRWPMDYVNKFKKAYEKYRTAAAPKI